MASGMATVGQSQVSLNPAWTPCPLQWAAAQLGGRSNHHFQPAFLPAMVLKLLNCLFQKALKNRSSLPSFHFFWHKCVLPEMAAVDRNKKNPTTFDSRDMQAATSYSFALLFFQSFPLTGFLMPTELQDAQDPTGQSRLPEPAWR